MDPSRLRPQASEMTAQRIQWVPIGTMPTPGQQQQQLQQQSQRMTSQPQQPLPPPSTAMTMKEGMSSISFSQLAALTQQARSASAGQQGLIRQSSHQRWHLHEEMPSGGLGPRAKRPKSEGGSVAEEGEEEDGTNSDGEEGGDDPVQPPSSDTKPPEEEKRPRRKIPIRYLMDKSKRHVTFSKRKSGLIKKTHELAVLTGSQVLLVIASDTNHIYTFSTGKLRPIVGDDRCRELLVQCLSHDENYIHSFPQDATAPDAAAAAGPEQEAFVDIANAPAATVQVIPDESLGSMQMGQSTLNSDQYGIAGMASSEDPTDDSVQPHTAAMTVSDDPGLIATTTAGPSQQMPSQSANIVWTQITPPQSSVPQRYIARTQGANGNIQMVQPQQMQFPIMQMPFIPSDWQFSQDPSTTGIPVAAAAPPPTTMTATATVAPSRVSSVPGHSPHQHQQSQQPQPQQQQQQVQAAAGTNRQVRRYSNKQ